MKTWRPGEYFIGEDSEEWNNFTCRHRHDIAICKCKLPLYHLGQDEAVFKQNALPSHYWAFNGHSKLRPKNEGQGIMVSAFWCELRGFGLQLTREKIAQVNAERALTGSLQLVLPEESPGLMFSQYGKNKDGYWDGALFQQQCIEVMNIVEVLVQNS